jgi:hypothetical protein
LCALYAVGMVAAALVWPGPGKAPKPSSAPKAAPAATPAADESVKPGYFSRTSAEGSARVFWSVPEDGKVSLTIEIPPEKAK